MADWLSSMQQTYEFYRVNPNTWTDVERLSSILSCTITRDSGDETLGYANIETNEAIDECYIRVYLITVQNKKTEKHSLGVFLCQTPNTSFDGHVQSISIDAYTPLIELKEKMPPIGYSISAGRNIVNAAIAITRENARAPVVGNSVSESTTDWNSDAYTFEIEDKKNESVLSSDFIADPSETWLSFLVALLSNASYEFDLDEMGRILFSPRQDQNSLQPVWTYTDDNSSILLPSITVDRDLYGIPNVVEVIYSQTGTMLYSKVVNDDPNSPISTVNRGREIVHRITDPDTIGNPTQDQLDVYATRTLRALSSLEYKLTYSHGYCPVRVGDCVMLNYERAGLKNVKARVISQTIRCLPGCTVEETAVYSTNLWG
mgnify:CR=1 FL=1